VTLQQSQKPVLEIDVGIGNVVKINNIRMLLKGPNKDVIEAENKEMTKKSSKKDVEKKSEGEESEKVNDSYCIILLKSGTLKIYDSVLSLDGDFNEQYSRVSCISAMPDSSLELINCGVKADI
jgi:hypothetical protein